MNLTKSLIVIILLLFIQITLVDNAAGQAPDDAAEQTVDDAALQASVEAKLAGEDFSDGSTINIETRKGVVQLGGWVKDVATAKAAVKAAESVEGVERLNNQLYPMMGERTAGQKVDDGVISTRVKTAVASADMGSGFTVNADTYNGFVLLTGFVDTQEHKVQAKDTASGVENVRNVINGLYVRP